jgi:hypothetical protein
MPLADPGQYEFWIRYFHSRVGKHAPPFQRKYLRIISKRNIFESFQKLAGMIPALRMPLCMVRFLMKNPE